MIPLGQEGESTLYQPDLYSRQFSGRGVGYRVPQPVAEATDDLEGVPYDPLKRDSRSISVHHVSSS